MHSHLAEEISQCRYLPYFFTLLIHYTNLAFVCFLNNCPSEEIFMLYFDRLISGTVRDSYISRVFVPFEEVIATVLSRLYSAFTDLIF